MTKAYTVDELKQLRELWGIDDPQKAKQLIPPHGNGGLFNFPGVRPEMYSTLPTPSTIAAMLPAFKSLVENEIYEVLTGQTADPDIDSTGHCDPASKPGFLKTCKQLVRFGDYMKQTRELNMAYAGTRHTRADVDRRLMNRPSLNSPFTLDWLQNTDTALNSDLGKLLMEANYSIELEMSNAFINGTFGTNGGGWISEPNGIDWWIRTGFADITTGVPCPSLDSLVIDGSGFAFGADLVTAMMDAYRTQVETARILNINNVNWVWVINPYLKYVLFDLWACNYNTVRCLTNGVTSQEATTPTQLRDQFYAGNYLLIDGQQVPVVTDFNMPNAATPDGFVTDIFLMPVSANGVPVTYWDYLPYGPANPDAQEIIVAGPNRDFDFSNNEFYLITQEIERACKIWHFHAKPRIIMDTPFLAARIDDVLYQSATPFRSPRHLDTYYTNGGNIYGIPGFDIYGDHEDEPL